MNSIKSKLWFIQTRMPNCAKRPVTSVRSTSASYGPTFAARVNVSTRPKDTNANVNQDIRSALQALAKVISIQLINYQFERNLIFENVNSDIDECKLRGYCQGGQCTNTIGSYRCSCPSGFDLSSDGKQCLGNWIRNHLKLEIENVKHYWNEKKITTSAERRECALTAFASTWTDRSNANVRKDTSYHLPAIRAQVCFSIEIDFKLNWIQTEMEVKSFRCWRVFGESAYLPQRALWEYSRIVWMRLCWGFFHFGRRSVLRWHGRMRSDGNVRQRQVHQHGRIVQMRLRFRLQIIVRWKNLRRSVDSNFPIQNQIFKFQKFVITQTSTNV